MKIILKGPEINSKFTSGKLPGRFEDFKEFPGNKKIYFKSQGAPRKLKKAVRFQEIHPSKNILQNSRTIQEKKTPVFLEKKKYIPKLWAFP